MPFWPNKETGFPENVFVVQISPFIETRTFGDVAMLRHVKIVAYYLLLFYSRSIVDFIHCQGYVRL